MTTYSADTDQIFENVNKNGLDRMKELENEFYFASIYIDPLFIPENRHPRGRVFSLSSQ